MIKIYGASDDLVEVEGCEGADEFNVYGSDKVMWRADLVTATESMRVHAIYDGCWSFAIGQVNESIPFPSWSVKIGRHPGFPGSDYAIPYTVLLEIDAPADVRLTNVWPVRGDDGNA